MIARPLNLARKLTPYPVDLRRALEAQYSARAGHQSKPHERADKWQVIAEWQREQSADSALHRELSKLQAPVWTLGLSDIDLAEHARKRAAVCEYFIIPTLTLPTEFPRALFGAMDDEAIARRTGDARVWHRVLRADYTRTIEHDLRGRGCVRKGRAAYVSDWATTRYRARRKKTRSNLEAATLCDADTGETLPLIDAVDASVSNPAIRRGELMTRARGLEEIAADHGHCALFVTLTTPSRFHPQMAAGGANPRYAGATAREAQAWLRAQWARARAKLKRLSVLYYGVRVAEPHHDGTPHWHLLIFAPAHEAARIETVLRDYWLADDGDEPGAAEHRVTIKAIDPGQGSAVGYLAKYVAKNIDGYRVGDDHEADAPAEETADRVLAWASTHGIRQFQQIGGPTIGLWRELRRIREPVEEHEVETPRLAADAGDYAGFVRAVGGIEIGRDTALRVATETPRAPYNRYGEPNPPRPCGVEVGPVRIRTRLKRWKIIFCDAIAALLSPLGPVSITVRGSRAVPPGGTSNNSAWVLSPSLAGVPP